MCRHITDYGDVVVLQAYVVAPKPNDFEAGRCADLSWRTRSPSIVLKRYRRARSAGGASPGVHGAGSVGGERGLRSPTAGLRRDAAALGDLPWAVIAQADDAGANNDHVAGQGVHVFSIM